MEQPLGLEELPASDLPDVADRRSLTGAVRSVWFPVSGWLLATVVVVATCALAGHSPFTTGPWIHWDAYEYLDISRHGYSLQRCFLANGLEAWCGNAGWFPAYPWLIRVIAAVGFDHAAVALTLSWLFSLATVVLIWAAFCPRVDAIAAGVVLFAAFAPGLVYDYAAFPLSMLAFLTVSYFALLKRRNYAAAGVVGCALVLTYPVGFAAPLGAGVGLLFAYRDITVAQRLRRIAVAVLPAVGALALVPIVQQETTGHWNAYFLAQANFGHWLADPFARTIHAARLLFHLKLFSLANAPYAQTLLVTFVVVCVLVAVAINWRTGTSFQVILVAWMLVAWAFPQATTGTSHYRGEAVLLPTAILIATLPRALAAAIVVGAVAVSIPMEVLFLRNTLV